MCWQDRIARETIIKLRDEFHIQFAFETGTYKGVNVEWLCNHFPVVFSVENNKEYFEIAKERLEQVGITNGRLILDDSPKTIKWVRQRINGNIFFYLDAHFYDPNRKQKFVVVDELKTLRGYGDCVICIHDFDNGEFGHLTYDGQPLNWDIIGEHIQKVNPSFYYYTNTECDIYTEDNIEGVTVDEVVLDNLRTFKGKDRRGILYATPKPLDLSKYKLREL